MSAAWFKALRRASWRGVPFGTTGGSLKVGRRQAVHQYPFRDEIWVEDIGCAARRMTLVGFLVGEDCRAQRERMIIACEAKGEGHLIHPTIGLLKGSLLDVEFIERKEDGLYFEVVFSFVFGTQSSPLPATNTATGSVVTAAAAAANAASAASFISQATIALKQGEAVVVAGVATAAKWANTAVRLSNEATSLYKTVTSLQGNFGRMFHGKTSISSVASSLNSSANTVQSLIGMGSVARNTVATAASNLTSASKNL